jgi:predicted acyl esterase
MSYINEANKEKEPGHDVLTMENYKEKRAEITGEMDGMLEDPGMVEGLKAMLEGCKKEEVMVKMRDGVELPMFVYRPNELTD